MPFWIMKSGLETFDVARAYGLAALLSYADEHQSTSPVIEDVGAAYRIDFPAGRPSCARLVQAWGEAFSPGDFGDPLTPQWNSLFITDTQQYKESKREQVRSVLGERFDELLRRTEQGLVAQFDKGETLPGGLDPVAFKGLRGRTRGHYTEGQMKVDQLNWALGCFGGALAGRFIFQRGAGLFVLYPVPEWVPFAQFRDIRQETYAKRLSYLSVHNAAAHCSVELAEVIRTRAASQLAAMPRYANLLYFSLFKTGKQWKPGGAGRLNLQPLLHLARDRPHEAAKVFDVWRYLFRRGSTRGSEDLAESVTAFVIHPTLETYERHVQVFVRYLGKGVKMHNLYSAQALQEVTSLVLS